MPAPVLVVHDEQNTRELAVAALRDAFLEVVGFDDPLRALDAIEARSRVRVLGYPPGLASSELVEIRAYLGRYQRNRGCAPLVTVHNPQGGLPGRVARRPGRSGLRSQSPH